MEPNDVPPHIKTGNILLCRCKQSKTRFFVARILLVDRVRRRCYARFEDNNTHWCDFADVQNLGCDSNRCCLCNKKPKDVDRVICTVCNLGFHQRCHNPAVTGTTPGWRCRVCTFNETACPNNVLSQGMPRRPSKEKRNKTYLDENDMSSIESLSFPSKKTKKSADKSSKLSDCVKPSYHGGRSHPVQPTGSSSSSKLLTSSGVKSPHSLSTFKSSAKDLARRRVSHARWIKSRAKQIYKPGRPRLPRSNTGPSSGPLETNGVPLSSLKIPQNVIAVSVINEAVAVDNVAQSTKECLHTAIVRHFGAVGRLEAGARCRITARRRTGDSVQYLVEWDNGVVT